MSDFQHIPLGDTIIKDGMVLLLKQGFGDTLLERLFRASGGGFGTHPNAISASGGKLFGTFLETGESGQVYRNDVLGLYRGQIPDEDPVWFRKPRHYWVGKMPEIIKFFTGYNAKWSRLDKGRKPAEQKAMDLQHKAYWKELVEGTKEVDTNNRLADDEFNKEEKRKSAGGSHSFRSTPAFSWAMGIYLQILMQELGRTQESKGKIANAAEGLMEMAEQIDGFNERQEANSNPHYDEALPYKCDWAMEERRAKRWTDAQLAFHIKDAREAVKAGANAGKYMDQLSVYVAEAKHRLKKRIK
jgi:hypothetical protein